MWLAAAVVLALLGIGGAAARAMLQYDRSGLQAGELWRLVTAHMVHLGPRHLLYNIAGLAMLAALFARELPWRRWLAVVLAAMLAIDAGLWWLQPRVAWYVGASGVLHGLWAAGAMLQVRRASWRSTLPLAALLLKLGAEQLQGGSMVLGDLPVIVPAHLYGAIGGVACALAWARMGKSL